MSEKTNIPPKIIDRDYSRKPYIPGSKDDYREMMERPTDKAMFNQRLEKQSEFKKPYLEDDYQAMEHFYPPPFPFVDFIFPHFKGPVPMGGEWDRLGVGYGTGCMVTCNSPLYCDDPVICRPSVFQHIKDYPESYSELQWKIYADFHGRVSGHEDGGRYRDTDHRSTLRPLVINPPDEGWAAWPDERMDEITVVMTDGADNECSTKLDVFCKEVCCPASVTFEWDTGNNPTTIESGNNQDIYVQGGCPPYTYTCSGTGATWNANGSTVLVSSNLNEQLDLADGT